ncbi:hypothetical protein [Bounagaea algeriensis]
MQLVVGEGRPAEQRPAGRTGQRTANAAGAGAPALLHAAADGQALCGAELTAIRQEPWDPNAPRACPDCVASAPAGPE